MNLDNRIKKILNELNKIDDLVPDVETIEKMTDREIDILFETQMKKFYRKHNIKSYTDLSMLLNKPGFIADERLDNEMIEFLLEYYRENNQESIK